MAWYDKPIPYSEYTKDFSFSDGVSVFLLVSGFCLFIEFSFWGMLNTGGGTLVLPWELWFLFFPVALITAIIGRRKHNIFANSVRNGAYLPHNVVMDCVPEWLKTGQFTWNVVLQLLPLRGRTRADFPIIGHSSFIVMVNRVLDELEQKVPDHYREALEYLPKAVYDTSVRPNDARSDGHFAIDGTGDYGRFRFVFLHELGHCINFVERHDNSEDAANNYAHMVIVKVA